MAKGKDREAAASALAPPNERRRAHWQAYDRGGGKRKAEHSAACKARTAAWNDQPTMLTDPVVGGCAGDGGKGGRMGERPRPPTLP